MRKRHLPLTVWFRAMWQVPSRKNGTQDLGEPNCEIVRADYQELKVLSRMKKVHPAAIRPHQPDC